MYINVFTCFVKNGLWLKNRCLAGSRVALVSLLALVLLACGGGSTGGTNKTPQDASKLTFDTAPLTKLTTDAAFTRGATKASDGVGSISYTSSDTDVATVDSSGEVTIVASGTTTITAMLSGDDTTASLSKSYQLTVNKSAQTALTYTGTQGNVNLSTASNTITFTLGGGSGEGDVSASSNNTDVATVTLNADKNGGTITLVGTGSATITLTKADDGDYTQTSLDIEFVVTNIPTNLTARAGDGKVWLGWTSSANNFRVHRATDSLTSVNPANFNSLDNYDSQDVTGSTLAKVTGLTNGTTYYFVVTVLADDGSEGGISNQVNVAPKPLQPIKLNDTGMTWGGRYPSGDNTTCTSDDTDGDATIDAQQDCNQGRDAEAAAGTLTKIGAGLAGFDFTKISSTGDTLAAGAVTWSCVKDNRTGLMWEVKTDDDGLHDKDDTYTWYNTDTTTNGGIAGTATSSDKPNTCYGYTEGTEASYCNTQAFVARVNAQGLCGANDWRLPDKQELLSIIDYSRSSPAIDAGYFPNTLSSTFWSSSNSFSDSNASFGVFFTNGIFSFGGRNNYFRVRLVRAGQ